MRAIRTALRHRGLRLLLGAGLISLTGDWILRVGLTYYIYVLTGSTLASALMLLASFVPQIVLSSLAGVFVDRWDSKRTMVISNLLLAAGLLPLLAVHSASEVWLVYAVTVWESCLAQFFTPAQQSVLPALTEDEHLVTANALNGQTSDVSRLVGSAVGGVVAAVGGISALALTDIVSFLLAAVLIARIATPHRERVTAGAAALGARLATLRAEWAEGLRVSTHQRVLQVILLFLAVTCVGEGIMGTLFAPFVRSVLHGSGQDYGFVVAAQAVGGIAGGLIAAAMGNRVRASQLFGWGAVAFGAIDLAMFLYPLAWVAVWPAVVCMVVVGLPGALTLAGAMTLLQRATSDGNRGRVFGAFGAVEGVAVVAGTIAAGLLGQATGIIPVLAAQGAGYVLAGFAVLAALRGRACEAAASRATTSQAAPGQPAPESPAAGQPAGAPAADCSLATSVSTSYLATEAPS
jgi:Na+/melibiose symporter-like transporter